MEKIGNARVLQGRWKLERSEHYVEFLKELGFNKAFIELAVNDIPGEEIILDGDRIKIEMYSAVGGTPATYFKLGEEFYMANHSIRCKCVAKWDDEKLKIVQTPFDVKRVKSGQLIVERQIVGPELVQTLYAGSKICKRFYTRR